MTQPKYICQWFGCNQEPELTSDGLVLAYCTKHSKEYDQLPKGTDIEPEDDDDDTEEES